jgi:NAD(P)-dependent dehydrogenase (short-subunit alcohol dehydrogenase family)
MRLENKIAAITGASSGIGRATALRFAAEGAKVGVLDLDDVGAAETVAAIHGSGGEAMAAHCDVTDSTSVDAAVAAVVETFGGLDIVHANAGIEAFAPLVMTDVNEWDHVFAVNVRGVFLTVKAALAHMIEGGGGNVIVTASVAGLSGNPFQPAYGASKAAVINLTKNVALDYASAGVRANAIAPGAADTPLLEKTFGAPPEGAMRAFLDSMHPDGRLATAEDVANVALFLASDESSHMNGAVVVVDGGLSAGQQFDMDKLLG